LVAVTALVAGVSVVGPAGTIAIGLITLIARSNRRRRRQRQQQALLDGFVPELIELVLVGVHAGLTAAQAMLRLSTIAPLPLQPALEAMESRLRGGDRFADALEALSERGGPAYRPLVFTLALAERTGDPIASVLDRLAGEARRHRRRLADASARELPVRLAVPLVSCTLPAFMLLTIAPVLAGALSSLAGSLP
jgi:tight adherence protein C